jgi:glycolate oxidase iron-sulfur subunit
MMQLGRYCRVPIVHTVDLLDWATGGPRPPALDGVVLREPPSAAAIQATDGGNDVGIW